jgi:medium-chain acyl-[acyl-carrier-protein] hydrolase
MTVYPDLTDDRRWLKRFGRQEPGEVQLLCFHHAGGNAAMFRDWPKFLPQSIEPIAIQLPGRADRFREPLYESMAPLIDDLIEIIKPRLDQPFACYGASMGARVAWALAHALRDRSMSEPCRLYVASSAAPSLDRSGRGWEGPDEELESYMRSLGGTPPEVFDDPELLQALLPILGADLTVLSSHLASPAAPLQIGIHAFAGTDDVEASPERMSRWREETTADFAVHPIQGGHFFTAEGLVQVTQAIADDLA